MKLIKKFLYILFAGGSGVFIATCGLYGPPPAYGPEAGPSPFSQTYKVTDVSRNPIPGLQCVKNGDTTLPLTNYTAQDGTVVFNYNGDLNVYSNTTIGITDIDGTSNGGYFAPTNVPAYDTNIVMQTNKQ